MGAAPSINARMIRLDVRITLFLVRTARMGYSPVHRRPNLLGIFPQRTRRVVSLSRCPFGFTFSEFGVGQFYVKSADLGVELDNVAILNRAIGPPTAASGPTWPTQNPRVAPENRPSVIRATLSPTLPVQRRSGGKHLPHTGATPGPLVADHEDLAFLVAPVLDRLETSSSIEAAGRTDESQLPHARDFHDRTLRREVTPQPDHTSRGEIGLWRTAPHPARVPFHALEVFGDCTARDGDASPWRWPLSSSVFISSGCRQPQTCLWQHNCPLASNPRYIASF